MFFGTEPQKIVDLSLIYMMKLSIHKNLHLFPCGNL